MKKSKKSRGKDKMKGMMEDKKRIIQSYIPEHPALTTVQTAWHNMFYAPGFEWRGLAKEYPARRPGCHEEWHYLDELNDPVLYEEMLIKMMEDLKKEEKIVWWKIEKQPTVWNEMLEMIILRCK